MISIKINNINFLVKKNISLLEACKVVGIFIPRFCYHEKLSVAGNCRMCLVDNGIKLVSSCTAVVEDNPQVFTDTPAVKKARENVIESLLLNHPLDCPICDQGGECDLQDQTKLFGGDYSRFFIPKRGVEDKECGPLVKTIMTRCIHCTRCVRFGTEIAGVDYFGTLNRGSSTEISNYIPTLFNSEISGNVIDLCPVGALTSKPYAFKARPWELRIVESIDLSDSLGSNIYLNFKETEIVRILPKNNISLNENWISDKARFSYDSLKNQRLISSFVKDKGNKKKLKWNSVLNLLRDSIHTKKFTFIIDEDLDMTSINLLKKIRNEYPKNVKVKNINSSSSNFSSNFINNEIKDLNKEITNCFLLSSNIKLENAILNTRLRSKYLNETFNLFALGLKSKNTIPVKTMNLNIKSIFDMAEGKSKILSKIFANTKTPLVILSSALKKRIKNIDRLVNIFKSYIPSSIILDLKEKSNSKGLSLIGGIKGWNTADINVSDTICFVNLEENMTVKKILSNFKGDIIWMNTHYSDLLMDLDEVTTVPALSYYEEENLFVNLEGRPQKTLKGINGPESARSLRKVFAQLLDKKLYTSKSFNHIIELLSSFDLKKTTSIVSFTNQENTKTTFSTYPLKSSIEDFYRNTNFLKNSIVMAECSQENRKNNTNF